MLPKQAGCFHFFFPKNFLPSLRYSVCLGNICISYDKTLSTFHKLSILKHSFIIEYKQETIFSKRY